MPTFPYTPWPRAARRSDADLPAPRADGKGQYAVESDARERDCDCREEARDRDEETWCILRLRQSNSGGSELRDGLSREQAPRDVSHDWENGAGVA